MILPGIGAVVATIGLAFPRPAPNYRPGETDQMDSHHLIGVDSGCVSDFHSVTVDSPTARKA